MAKRAINTAPCSQCLIELDMKEMYLIQRYMFRLKPEQGSYNTYYCKACTVKTKGTEWQISVVREPKIPKPEKAKKVVKQKEK